MQKVPALDSGGLESPAVLGEDFAQSLSILQWGVEVPASEAVARLARTSPFQVGFALLVLVGGGCLLLSLHRGDLRLALAVLPLTAWGMACCYRGYHAEKAAAARREDAAEIATPHCPVMVIVTCRVCGEHYLVAAAGAGPTGKAGVGVRGEDRGVSLCSPRCQERWIRDRGTGRTDGRSRGRCRRRARGLPSRASAG